MAFKTNTIIQEAKDLSKFGKNFQVKLLSLLIKDRVFSFSILPIIKDIYFSDVYLKTIFVCIKEYVDKFQSTPSIDNLRITLQLLGESLPTYEKILESIDNIDLEDRDFVMQSSREFCFTKHALAENKKVETALKEGQISIAKKLSVEAFQYSGLETAKIIDLKKDIDKVCKKQEFRAPLETMFPTFNANSKGGIAEGDLCIVIAPSNFGKCFGKGTKIRMANYSLKNIEDIKVGERVLGYDGLPRTVAHTIQGTEELFEIEQKNGINYVVNKSHILALKKKKYKIVNYKSKKEKIKHQHLLNDKEFINIEVKDYLNRTNNWKKSVTGYKSGTLEFIDENVLIDPYYLGLWLGDGSHECTQISNIDKEVIDYLGEYVKVENLRLSNYGTTNTKQGLGWGLVNEAGKPNQLKDKLKGFNLIKNKHIPENYLFSSRHTRLQLLAGLLDSDGYLDQITGTNFEISQKRKDLAWQIYILASSLGFKTNYKESKNKKYGCVTIAGDTYLIPTKIKRKQANKRKKNYDSTNTEIKVNSIGIGDYYGFSILEEDKKFLLEDFTVVHNSQWLVAQARHLNFIGKNVAFFSYEMEAEPLFEKYMAGLFDTSQNDVFRLHKDELAERLKDNKLGDLKIITDKASNATLANIQSQLGYLNSTGFFPDAIIIDGLNQLKLPPGVRAKDDNEKYEILTENLKDLCKELKLPGWACWQTNRSGFSSELNGIESIGKAIEVFQKADQVITFSQTPQMKEKLECIAYLLKNRLGKKEITLLCYYDPSKVLFHEIEVLNSAVLLSSKEKKVIRNNVAEVREKLKTGAFLEKNS